MQVLERIRLGLEAQLKDVRALIRNEAMRLANQEMDYQDREERKKAAELTTKQAEELRNTPITRKDVVSGQAFNALTELHGITNWYDLVTLTENQLHGMHGIGHGSARYLLAAVRARGLHLNMREKVKKP